MRKQIVLCIIVCAISSCKIAAPTFKNIGQWQVSKISGSEVVLSNSANFYNPNNIDGLKVNTVQIEVQTGGKKLGTISQSGTGITIPKMSDFSVPLSLTVNIQDLIGNIADIISILSGRTIDLRVVGDVNVGYAVVSRSIRVDQVVPINISDIKK